MVFGNWTGLNISLSISLSFLLSFTTSSFSCSLTIGHLGTFLQHSLDFTFSGNRAALCTHYPLMSPVIIPKARWHGSWTSKEYFPSEINASETYRWDDTHKQLDLCVLAVKSIMITVYKCYDLYLLQWMSIWIASAGKMPFKKWNTTAIRELCMM